MYNINISNARANLYNLVRMAIEDSELINLSTKEGNAIIISEADYNSLVETLYLSSDSNYKKTLIDGINTPISECVKESDVEW